MTKEQKLAKIRNDFFLEATKEVELNRNDFEYGLSDMYCNKIAWMMARFAQKKTIKDAIDVLEFMAED